MARSLFSQSTFVFLLAFLSFLAPAVAAETKAVKVMKDGEEVWVKDNRRPSLYTGDFGDCMGSSTVNVTRFDAAYYKDNMTVLFHLEGNTAVKNESLMSMLLVVSRPDRKLTIPSIHWCVRVW